MSPWTADIMTKSCGEIENRKFCVVIPQNIHDGFLTLIKEIKTEWLLYLTYEQEDREKLTIYTVTGYVIPEQEVSSAAVKVVEAPEGDFGVIHAHQFTESRFFSGTDNEHVNSNNAFSVVINKAGEYLGKTRVRTPCDKFLSMPCEIAVPFAAHPTIVDELKEQIKEKTYSYQRGTQYNPQSRGGTTTPSKGTARQHQQNLWENNKTADKKFSSSTERTIKRCPHKEDIEKCSITSYFLCMYLWDDCPKKVSVKTIPSVANPTGIEEPAVVIETPPVEVKEEPQVKPTDIVPVSEE